MEITTAKPAQTSRHRLRPAYRWLMVLLLLVGVIGWGWWNTPRRLTRVMHARAYGDFLLPCRDGFFYWSADTAVSLREWDGNPRWTVTHPKMSYADTEYYCVSPSGRHYAFACEISKQITLMIWENGTRVATHRLPPLPPRSGQSLGISSVKTLDDGRVILTLDHYRPNHPPFADVIIYQGATRIAEGRLPGKLVTVKWTPDASVVATWSPGPTFSYAPVTIRDGRITFAPIRNGRGTLNLENYGYQGGDNYPALYREGLILTEKGLAYRADGTVARAFSKAWEHDETISPAGTWTMLLKKGVVRAFHPASGQGWQFRVRNCLGGDITDDGRYIMAWCHRDTPPAFEWLALHFGWDTLRSEYIAIYERPGRLRASMLRGDWMSWWISPDGHAVATMNEYDMEVTLYRWK